MSIESVIQTVVGADAFGTIKNMLEKMGVSRRVDLSDLASIPEQMVGADADATRELTIKYKKELIEKKKI